MSDEKTCKDCPFWDKAPNNWDKCCPYKFARESGSSAGYIQITEDSIVCAPMKKYWDLYELLHTTDYEERIKAHKRLSAPRWTPKAQADYIADTVVAKLVHLKTMAELEEVANKMSEEMEPE